MEKAGFRSSFLTLGGMACLAFLVLLFAIPETAHNNTGLNQLAKG
jgi:predicted MFS family arabinose efflux permease